MLGCGLKSMPKDHLKFLALLVPNFCLFYAYAWSSFQVVPERREAFGASDLYLDIKYSSYPSRDLKTGEFEAADFDGVLATDVSQSNVKGRRFIVNGKIWYTFFVGDTKFVGWLSPATKGCEPQLNYQMESDGHIRKKGSMRAGFCS